jgi:RNA-directed DNA polymerase
MPDGSLVARNRGTPQAAVVSPVLANLFLHYVFDCWMRRKYPAIPFERYAADAICHCQSEAQALELRQVLEQRFAEWKLQLHPQKTKVVYCKDANRLEQYPERSFDFLGYTFRPRDDPEQPRLDPRGASIRLQALPSLQEYLLEQVFDQIFSRHEPAR